MKTIREKFNEKKGFVLLFTALLVSVVLAVALQSADIAAKEISFSTSAQNTNDAFFAADAGSECALYNDKTTGTSFIQTGSSGTVTCLGNTIPLSGSYPVWSFILTGLGNSGQGCAKVTVDKTASPAVTVDSKGYNIGNASCVSTSPSLVQRELQAAFSEGTVNNISAISGVTAPVTGATPVSSLPGSSEYTDTISWSGNPSTFAGSTVYTATITLTPKTGYTLNGVPANYFTVAGATATNSANSGVVSAVFPATGTLTLVVGNSYEGGIVAYILQSGDPGYDPNVQHGLIAATSNQSTGIYWSNGTNFISTGATAIALGTGLANTNTIITKQGAPSTNYAAGLARAYTGGGYTDWYLPSLYELNKLYLNRTAIGGFNNSGYWTSSEYDTNDAYDIYFGDGTWYHNQGKDANFLVRAVRSF